MTIVCALPGNEAMAHHLATILDAQQGHIESRRFTDGESYVRFEEAVDRKHVVLVCTLAHPDSQILRLLFAADAARDLGARMITLVAPYLAYMRQDKRFRAGEAISSRSFAFSSPVKRAFLLQEKVSFQSSSISSTRSPSSSEIPNAPSRSISFAGRWSSPASPRLSTSGRSRRLAKPNTSRNFRVVT